MGPRKAIVRLVLDLGEQFPGFNPSKETVAAWERALGHYTDEQLARGGAVVARTHRFGPPSTAHVCEAIEGRIETVLEPNLDYGLTSENGRPMLQSKRYRVFPDGTRQSANDPLRLEGGERDRGPLLLGAAMDALLAAPPADPHEAALADAIAPEAFTRAWKRVREFFAGTKHDPAVVAAVRAWAVMQGERVEAAVEEKITAAEAETDPRAAFLNAIPGVPV